MHCQSKKVGGSAASKTKDGTRSRKKTRNFSAKLKEERELKSAQARLDVENAAADLLAQNWRDELYRGRAVRMAKILEEHEAQVTEFLAKQIDEGMIHAGLRRPEHLLLVELAKASAKLANNFALHCAENGLSAKSLKDFVRDSALGVILPKDTVDRKGIMEIIAEAIADLIDF